MSIRHAIDRAYQVMKERNWDTIYWAIDLHGVCFPSNYHQGDYQFINDACAMALQAISRRPESRIILWSSCYPSEYQAIIDFMARNGVNVMDFNANPNEKNTRSGCFDSKFYFSILLDDKAGFDPGTDWMEVMQALSQVKA